MKYLKSYIYIKKSDELDKMEDLSEYLQELFDRYNITHTKEYDKTLNTWCFGRIGKVGSKKTDPSIQIDFSDDHEFHMRYDFFDSLKKIKPQIEKRIGCELKISKFISRIVIKL